jgi:hypothetical protein
MPRLYSEEQSRAANKHKAGKTKVTVGMRNQVTVVPMEHLESYVTHEIVSEGTWASARELIIIQPPHDAGRTDSNWIPRMLERMRETRRRKGTIPFRMATDGGDIEIDVGLVDVTVFFEMPPGLPPSLPTTHPEYDMASTENFRHFDAVCGGALHDQMIVASALHFFHTDGSPLFHYHNLIFGLRQEVRGDIDILGPLDMEPLLKALSRSGPVNIIAAIKQ